MRSDCMKSDPNSTNIFRCILALLTDNNRIVYIELLNVANTMELDFLQVRSYFPALPDDISNLHQIFPNNFALGNANLYYIIFVTFEGTYEI